jgi:hypothetical protein
MASLPGARWPPNNTALESAWVSEYGRYEADREFQRARRSALVRRIASVWARGNRRSGSIAQTGTCQGEPQEVPINSIVGTVDSRGITRRYLPVMSRRLATAWRIAFCSEAFEPGPVEVVQAGTREWYLSGGPVSVFQVEMMRARGFQTVRLPVSVSAHAIREYIGRVHCLRQPPLQKEAVR